MIHYNQQDMILSNIGKIFEKRYRGTTEVTLVLDKSLDEFCGKIEDGVISAGSYGQLLDTAGRFLRHPDIRNQTFVSHKKIPGMYITTHFQNYLDAAPLEEIYRYFDDLSLWGMDTVGVWFDMHHFKNMEEGRKTSDRLIAMLRYAKSIGLKTAMSILANEAFAESPQTLRADWTCGHDGYIYDLNSHYHLEICPSIPGGMEQIIEYRRQMLEVFADLSLDYIYIGPYDQGGCTCSACAPWGSNGLVKCCEALIPVIREYFPKAQIILSLWQFGTFTGTEVEFEGLVRALEEGRLSEVDYLVSEPQYASYAFCHDMHRPLLNFPEISMFGASPWGGFGANPMPKLLEGLWQQYGDKLVGGMPYSEGIFEDINKVVMLRFYRDNQPAADTVREYLAYEFGLSGVMLEQMQQAVMDMEETLEREHAVPYKRADNGDWVKKKPEELLTEPHRYIIKHPDKVLQIEQTVSEADKTLPEAVRSGIKWQLLYLRAKIDGELVRNNYYRNDTVLGYFKKLIAISHLENAGPHTKPDIED